MPHRMTAAVLASSTILLAGCSATTEEASSTEIPAVKVPLMWYKMSKRPSVPWDAATDYKAVGYNHW